MAKSFKKVAGIGAALFLLPFYGVLWIGYAFVPAWRDFCKFSKDLIHSMSEPDHVPNIGLKGFYALKRYRQSVLEAAAEDDMELEIKYLKKCAALFDTHAMCRLAKYYSIEKCSRSLVREWYGIAASFGHQEAEREYRFVCGYEITREEKVWFRKTFIKNCRNLLKEQI